MLENYGGDGGKRFIIGILKSGRESTDIWQVGDVPPYEYIPIFTFYVIFVC